jgi:hypothetical protein
MNPPLQLCGFLSSCLSLSPPLSIGSPERIHGLVLSPDGPIDLRRVLLHRSALGLYDAFVVWYVASIADDNGLAVAYGSVEAWTQMSDHYKCFGFSS